MREIITARNITKKINWSQDTVLDLLTDANFYAREGELLVLTGQSGTGKSTLLRILLGYDKIPGSEIIINNKNINGMSEEKLHAFRNESIGICIPEITPIYKHLTVRQSLCQKNKTLFKNSKEKNTEEFLSAFGLASKADNEVSSLSKMDLYRLMLAMSFYGTPPLVFIDEVLDYFNDEEANMILQNIIDIQKKYGLTVIIVTVKITIINKCDRAINIMDNTTYWIDLKRLREITGENSNLQ